MITSKAELLTFGRATKKGFTFALRYPAADRYLSTSQRSPNSLRRLSNLLATTIWTMHAKGAT